MATKQQKLKDWLLFENEVRQLVEAFGYEAETTQPSHDNGVDVIGFNHRHRVVIQCKLYGRGRIGNEVILKLIGSRALYDATEAICITTSNFTKGAREIADKQNVLLIDRDMLLRLCRERNLIIPSLTVLLTSTGQTFHVQRPSLSFGREHDNNIVLPDKHVSRHHARLERDGLTLRLHDCQSTNGAFVNGTRVAHPVVLNYGDEFRIGSTSLRVCLRLKTGELV